MPGTLGYVRAPGWLPGGVSESLFTPHWVYAIGLLVAGLLLWFFAPKNLRKPLRRGGAGLVLIAVGWMLLALLFDSPGERLNALHTRIVEAASAGDGAAIVGVLAPDFRFGTAGKTDMGLQVDTTLKMLKPKSNLIRFYEATISDERASTKINIFTTLDSAANIPTGPYLTKWQLSWRDDPASDWQLTAIEHWYMSDGKTDTEMPTNLP